MRTTPRMMIKVRMAGNSSMSSFIRPSLFVCDYLPIVDSVPLS